MKTGTPPSSSIPVARVIPQPSVSRDAAGLVTSGYVVAGTFVQPSRALDTNTQTGPVNLTVSDRSVVTITLYLTVALILFNGKGLPSPEVP